MLRNQPVASWLTRLQISNFGVVFVATTTRSLALHVSPPPFVHFPSYTQNEILQIVSGDAPSINLKEHTTDTDAEDDQWLWTRFCSAVWDSQAKFIARDVVSFRAIAGKLWGPFVQPIRNGSYGSRDFSKLVVANRSIFQSDELLQNKIVHVSVDEPNAVPCESLGKALWHQQSTDTSKIWTIFRTTPSIYCVPRTWHRTTLRGRTRSTL